MKGDLELRTTSLPWSGRLAACTHVRKHACIAAALVTMAMNVNAWLHTMFVEVNVHKRSVFIYCSHMFEHWHHGRPFILLKTHVVLVRVACGTNVQCSLKLITLQAAYAMCRPVEDH